MNIRNIVTGQAQEIAGLIIFLLDEFVFAHYHLLTGLQTACQGSVKHPASRREARLFGDVQDRLRVVLLHCRPLRFIATSRIKETRRAVAWCIIHLRTLLCINVPMPASSGAIIVGFRTGVHRWAIATGSSANLSGILFLIRAAVRPLSRPIIRQAGLTFPFVSQAFPRLTLRLHARNKSQRLAKSNKKMMNTESNQRAGATSSLAGEGMAIARLNLSTVPREGRAARHHKPISQVTKTGQCKLFHLFLICLRQPPTYLSN